MGGRRGKRQGRGEVIGFGLSVARFGTVRIGGARGFVWKHKSQVPACGRDRPIYSVQGARVPASHSYGISRGGAVKNCFRKAKIPRPSGARLLRADGAGRCFG